MISRFSYSSAGGGTTGTGKPDEVSGCSKAGWMAHCSPAPAPPYCCDACTLQSLISLTAFALQIEELQAQESQLRSQEAEGQDGQQIAALLMHLGSSSPEETRDALQQLLTAAAASRQVLSSCLPLKDSCEHWTCCCRAHYSGKAYNK